MYALMERGEVYVLLEVPRSREVDGVESQPARGGRARGGGVSISCWSCSLPLLSCKRSSPSFHSPNFSHSRTLSGRMTSPSTLIPLLLRHSLPHIPSHGFSLESLSLASLSLPPPYHYSNALNSAAISTLFGPGRGPQRSLVKEWLMEKRGEMGREWKRKEKEGIVSSTSSTTAQLQEILESRLEMNEQVRPWLAEVSSFQSLLSSIYYQG